MNQTISKSNIKETTALQIFCVIVWLWAIPVIDSLDSLSYGLATRALLISFISLTVGIIASAKLPNRYNVKLGKPILIIGGIVLLFSLILFVPLAHTGWYGHMRYAAIFRFIGFAFLGYGLHTTQFTLKIKSFWRGLLWISLLYGLYNLLIYISNNINFEIKILWMGTSIVSAIVRIAIVVMLWKTLAQAEIQQLLNKSPKISLLVAGLFWGMILVLPADSYSPKWLAIVMLLVAPMVAYIMTVIVRMSLSIISYLIKGFLENKFWWLESCCWWIDKGNYNKNTEK